MSVPILFNWEGDVFRPLARFDKICAKEFVIGQLYKMDVIDARSMVSHAHYFASLHDGWLNLPEKIAGRFPSSEHLRKFALIQCGYCNERKIALKTPDEAREVAAFIRPMDEYGVVVVNGCIVSVLTAKSQSHRAMPDKKEFQASKQAVLEYVSALIGTSAGKLEQNARRSA